MFVIVRTNSGKWQSSTFDASTESFIAMAENSAHFLVHLEEGDPILLNPHEFGCKWTKMARFSDRWSNLCAGFSKLLDIFINLRSFFQAPHSKFEPHLWNWSKWWKIWPELVCRDSELSSNALHDWLLLHFHRIPPTNWLRPPLWSRKREECSIRWDKTLYWLGQFGHVSRGAHEMLKAKPRLKPIGDFFRIFFTLVREWRLIRSVHWHARYPL